MIRFKDSNCHSLRDSTLQFEGLLPLLPVAGNSSTMARGTAALKHLKDCAVWLNLEKEFQIGSSVYRLPNPLPESSDGMNCIIVASKR